MTPFKHRRFRLTPAAWLVSCYLFGSLGAQQAFAEELLNFMPAAPQPPAAAVATQPGSAAPRRRDNDLISFSPNPAPAPAAPPAPVATATPVFKPAPALARPEPAAPKAASVSRKSNDLLTFEPIASPPVVRTVTPARPIPAAAATSPQPGAGNGLAQFTQTSRVAREAEQQVHSVSALSLAALPPRLAARSSERGTLLGPSEFELRQVFNRAVEAAILRAPTISRAKAEQQAAVEDIDEAKGQRWPQVDVGTQTSPVNIGKGSDVDSGSSGINLAVTTPVYDWGRIGHSIDSRERLLTAAEENLEAEKETLGYEVTTTIIELGKQRIIVDLSQQFADRMNDLVKMLAGIVAVDKGRTSELTQAKARLLQAQALRDAAAAKARDAEINLSKLVGERPVPIPVTREWNIRLANLDLLLDAAKEHPTIRKSIAETESAVAQAKAVRASGLPQLNWVISKSTAEDSLGREQPWQTNLSMTWGAFRGGSTRAAERAALQRADASRYANDQQRRDLEFRIRTADHDARTMLERSELYRDLGQESGRIREDFFQQWHHLGKRTLLDVLTAENEHYGNQVNEINNRFDGYQAILRQYAGAGTLARWLRTGS
ncbi:MULTISPECIES: TolC family protein [Pseudomonas]|uniref:TolC family protein n=1 Tax=Pseudomonas TaxID=286 RepID=UPI000A7B0545|nr:MULTISPECIES: TolC family protein [Pseudomonas]MDI3205514.1 TolC family protein [Pseudomonas shahriarae]WLI37195.1 TolC family protein [Pseudomonas sp. FP818]